MYSATFLCPCICFKIFFRETTFFLDSILRELEGRKIEADLNYYFYMETT